LFSFLHSAFAQYNKDQFTPCHVDGSEHNVLITEHGDVGGGRFLDPRSRQTFRYDHLRKEASDVRPASVDQSAEPWRKAVEQSFTNYYANHYTKAGACSVYGSTDGDSNITLTVCLESHQFNPKNFW
jgi:capping protein alpha